MNSLAKAHHEKVEFVESIRRATLWSSTEYDQMEVRRAAATYVQAYRDHMDPERSVYDSEGKYVIDAAAVDRLLTKYQREKRNGQTNGEINN